MDLCSGIEFEVYDPLRSRCKAKLWLPRELIAAARKQGRSLDIVYRSVVRL